MIQKIKINTFLTQKRRIIMKKKKKKNKEEDEKRLSISLVQISHYVTRIVLESIIYIYI